MSTVALGREVTELSYPAALMALWITARRRGDSVPVAWRILNIISGMSWIRDRVNSSWAIVGTYPRPP